MAKIREDFQLQLEEQIKACIHCGMCLPACPTYNVTANEANSPRGRIYLINDFIQSDSVEEKLATEYLDNCLSCYACESVCPSNVDYEGILDFARKDLKLSNYTKGFGAYLRRIFFKNFINDRFALNLLRVFMKLFNLPIKIVFNLFGLAKLSKLMPQFAKKYKKLEEGEVYYSDLVLKLADEKRIINLSLGCVMDSIYNNIHHDTVKVLNAFGYHVHISKSQCCGALASHSGEHELGKKLKKQFKQVVASEGLPLVVNSAGCGAFLKAHNESSGVYDLVELLKKAPYNPLANKSFQTQVLYHPACHLNHRQHLSDEYEKLLQQIDGLELHCLDSKDLCCGSAGFYNLINQNMANKIGLQKTNEIEDTNIKTLITANPGCMSQLKSLLKSGYKVMHPASFLRQVLNLN